MSGVVTTVVLYCHLHSQITQSLVITTIAANCKISLNLVGIKVGKCGENWKAKTSSELKMF